MFEWRTPEGKFCRLLVWTSDRPENPVHVPAGPLGLRPATDLDLQEAIDSDIKAKVFALTKGR